MGLLAVIAGSGSTNPVDNGLNTIYVVVGIMAALIVVFGAGGVTGLIRNLKKTGIRESKLDQIIANQATPEQVKKQILRDSQLDTVLAEWPGQKSVLLEIRAELSPNSGHSLRDSINRVEQVATETARVVQGVRTDLDDHLTASQREHRAMWDKIESQGHSHDQQ